jgi:hypothetical protein
LFEIRAHFLPRVPVLARDDQSLEFRRRWRSLRQNCQTGKQAYREESNTHA